MKARLLQLAPFVISALTIVGGPACAHPAPAERGSPQARIDAAVRELGNNPRFKTLFPKFRQELTEFVVGNMLFVMLHELGHAATTEMKIPVLGRKEDEADTFGVTRLLKIGSGFTDGVLEQAAKGWFYADRRDRATGDAVPFYDEHGFNQQRAYQIVCLMVGTGQKKYQYLAAETKLPKDRQQSCAGDFTVALESWDAVLTPHR